MSYKPYLQCEYGPLDKGLDMSGDFFSVFTPGKRKELVAAEAKFYERLHEPYSVDEKVEKSYEHFKTGDGAEISVKLYRPKGEKGALPLWVFCHGGGFITCTVETHDYVPSYVAAKAKIAVASIEYRLAPEFPFPTGLEDCFSAIAWAHDKAQVLGVDPRKIYVGGDSSGGNFAAALCLMDRDRKTRCLSKQILIYPATDLSGTAPSKSAAAYAPVGGKGLDFISMYCRDKKDVLNPLVSPLLAEDFVGLPPALFIEAECDALLDGGLMYAQKLHEAGIPVKVSVYRGMPHAFILRTFPKTFQALDAICDFLAR